MTKKTQTPQEDMAAELLLKDADEALRQDRLHALWQEWGSTIIGVALMIVLGTMIGTGWRSWRDSVHSEQTAAILNDTMQDTSGSFRGVANFLEVGKIAGDNTPAIIHDLMQEAADSGLPREWDILAEWGEYRAQADLEDSDKIAVAADMETLAHKKDNPYRPAILMESAVLYGENGQTDKAVSLLEEAQQDPLSATAPAMSQIIDQLITLYKTEQSA